MFLRRYQWVLGVVWLIVAGVVLFRDSVLPPAVLARMKTENGWLIVLMAVVFAGWNFSRWYVYSHRAAYRPPIVPAEKREREELPEFDFRRDR